MYIIQPAHECVLMIVYYFNICCIATIPLKNEPPFVVYSKIATLCSIFSSSIRNAGRTPDICREVELIDTSDPAEDSRKWDEGYASTGG